MSTSTDSYTNLLGGMWAPEGSEINNRLKKLQELEQMRKERESRRRELLNNPEDNLSTRQRRVAASVRPSRVNRVNSQDSSSSSQIQTTRYPTRNTDPSQRYVDTYGGARPKFATTSDAEPSEELGSMLNNITQSILNKPSVAPRKAMRSHTNSDSGSNYATSGRSRFGSTDSEDSYTSTRSERSRYGSSNTGTQYGNYNRSNRHDTGGTYDTESQAIDATGALLSSITDSILGKNKYGQPSSYHSYQPRNRDFQSSNRHYSGTSTYGSDDHQFEGEQTLDNPDGQMEGENGEQYETFETEETFDEPLEFIERLNKLENSDNTGSSENLHHKRTGSYGLPTLLPMKKSKCETDEDNADKCNDVSASNEAVESILDVAHDIHATFGKKSPIVSESGTATNNDGFDFTSSANGETESVFHVSQNLNVNGDNTGDVVFTAKSPGSPVIAPKRTNSKRKNRSSDKGKDSFMKRSGDVDHSSINGADKQLKSKVDETYMNVTTTEENGNDDSLSYEIIELDDSEDENPDLLRVRKSLYNPGSSEWALADQSPGKLDVMQEFFSGEKVEGDPKITHLLSGQALKDELDKSMRDSPAKNDNETVGSKNVDGHRNKIQMKETKTLSDAKQTESIVEMENVEIKTPKMKKAPEAPSVWERLSKHNSKGLTDCDSVESNKSDPKSDNDFSTSGSESDAGQIQKGKSQIKNNKKAQAVRHSTNEKKQVNSSVKTTGKDTGLNVSLDDKLTKLQSMTKEIIRRHSANEDDIADVVNRMNAYSSARSTPSTERNLSTTDAEGSKSVPHKSTGKHRLETHKSSKDLVKDLKNYVHENVSPRDKVTNLETPELEKTFQDDCESKLTTEIGIQTAFEERIDTFVLVYICKHCGKSSEDEVSVDNNANEVGKTVKQTIQTHEKKDMKSKVTGSVPSYMQSTTSSLHKYSKPPVSEKSSSRKSSLTEEFNKPPTAGINSTRSVKGLVAQRTNTFDNSSGKAEIVKRKGKTGLSVFSRDNSLDRKRQNFSKTPSFENAHSKLSKSKSWDQMYLAESLSGNLDKSGAQLNTCEVTCTENQDASNDMSTANSDATKQILRSPGTKQTHSEIVKKIPPPVMPKPVKSVPVSPKLERKTSLSASTSPVRTSPRRSLSKSISKEDVREMSRSTPVMNSGTTTPGVNSGRTTPLLDSDTNVELQGIFTTLEDSPFIKNDIRRRSSKGRKGESVWEKTSLEGESGSRDSSLRRSRTSCGERASLTQLSWSGSGSSGSLRGSRSSIHGSDPNLTMGSTLRRASSEKILTGSSEKPATNSRISPKASKPSTPIAKDSMGSTLRRASSEIIVTGSSEKPATNSRISPKASKPSTPFAKDSMTSETDIDEAFRTFNDPKNKSQLETTEIDETTSNTHLEFAHKVCSMLESASKSHDSDCANERVAHMTNCNVNQNRTKPGVSEQKPTGHADAATDGKKKKSFFKGKLFRK